MIEKDPCGRYRAHAHALAIVIAIAKPCPGAAAERAFGTEGLQLGIVSSICQTSSVSAPQRCYYRAAGRDKLELF